MERSSVKGVIFSVLAGLGSTTQNVTFSYAQNLQELARSMGCSTTAAANIIWPFFLFWSGIPYIAYMLYLHRKNHSFGQYKQKGIRRYYPLTMLMAVLSYGALLLYGKASQLIGPLGPVVGWPMLMVVIILTSNFWSWKLGEWKTSSKSAAIAMNLGIILLLFSVILLGFSTTR